MIIFLSDLQKEHLKFLNEHSAQVVVDFCKLANDYLNNGANSTKYKNIADKFQVAEIVIQNIIHALLYLIIEGCKLNLTESDFKSSLELAGFSTEQQNVLVHFYNTKKDKLSDCLHILHQKDARYQDFTWRLDIQLASMHRTEEIEPNVTMDFVLKTPKNFADDSRPFKNLKQTQAGSVTCVNVPIIEAKADSQCHNVISHNLVKCSLPNVVHLTDKLEQALKESKSQHVRKIKRCI